jgi:hypothetical protein
MTLPDEHEPDVTSDVAWRRTALVDSGLPPALASSLARRRRTDLHALIELVEVGIDPSLALRLTQPFDGPDAA